MQLSIQQSLEQLKEHIDMARSEKNLTAVFTDTASAIRAKTGTTEQICPLDFADKINAIQTGGGGDENRLKAFFTVGGKCKDITNESTVVDLTKILKYGDTSEVESFYSFFMDSKISAVPLLDTRKGKSFSMMFYRCGLLKEIPPIDTSHGGRGATDEMCSFCRTITTMPTNIVYNGLYETFWGCTGLETIPDSEVTHTGDASAEDAFNGCTNLKSIGRLNFEGYTSFNNMCYGCTSLERFGGYNIHYSFNLSASTKFTREALLEVLNNLTTVSNTTTLNLGATNLAKLTDEDKAIATNKGWTLA